jgi:hypothetical protein
VTQLRFTKYQGLGNDFIVVESDRIDSERAIRLCDRHRGIGADGVLVLGPPSTPGALATMRIFNPDGSMALMCGNGIRCVARHIADPIAFSGPMIIDTDSGPRVCTVNRGEDGVIGDVSVEMGPARLEGNQRFMVGEEEVDRLPDLPVHGVEPVAGLRRLGDQRRRRAGRRPGGRDAFLVLGGEGIAPRFDGERQSLVRHVRQRHPEGLLPVLRRRAPEKERPGGRPLGGHPPAARQQDVLPAYHRRLPGNQDAPAAADRPPAR